MASVSVRHLDMLFYSCLVFFAVLLSTESKTSFSHRHGNVDSREDPTRKTPKDPSEASAPSNTDSGLESKLSPGNLKFTKDLYNIIAREPGNIVFSPLSLELALILVYNGASGNTLAEIKEVLRLPDAKENTLKEAEGILKLTKKSNINSLKIANGIFFNEDFNIKQDYIDSSNKYLSAKVEKVNFGRSSEAARMINKFIEESTNHTISNLFTPDAFNERDTKVVLVNTVYFAGLWAKQFYSTHEGDFHLNEKEVKKIQFMSRRIGNLGVREDENLDATVIKMKYHSPNNKEKISMVLLVPNKINGLANLERRIKNVDLIRLAERDNLQSRKIELHLPKFKIDKTLDLIPVLTELGMGQMLSPSQASFQGMSTDKNLYLQKVLQKAFIEVHEKGTTAAAVTIGEFGPTSIDTSTYQEVHVDKPFIFYILDEGIGLPVFMGRVVSP